MFQIMIVSNWDIKFHRNVEKYSSYNQHNFKFKY